MHLIFLYCTVFHCIPPKCSALDLIELYLTWLLNLNISKPTPQGTLAKSICQHNLFWLSHLRPRRFKPLTPVLGGEVSNRLTTQPSVLYFIKVHCSITPLLLAPGCFWILGMGNISFSQSLTNLTYLIKVFLVVRWKPLRLALFQLLPK